MRSRGAIAFLALVFVTSTALAGSKKVKLRPPAELPSTVISAVTPASITIVEDKVTKSFAITQFTDTTVNGQRARVSDLQPGMSVHLTLAADPSKLSRIDAGPAPVKPGR